MKQRKTIGVTAKPKRLLNVRFEEENDGKGITMKIAEKRDRSLVFCAAKL